MELVAAQDESTRKAKAMENWNPYAWLCLLAGFLAGLASGWLGHNYELLLISYVAILTGLAILTTNMLRALWRYSRRR